MCTANPSAGLYRMNSQRYTENLFHSLLLCATHATRHGTSYPLQFTRPALSNFTVPPKIEGITNDLGCWCSRDFAKLPCKERPKSNHSTPTILLSPEYRSKVYIQSARKGFSASFGGHSLPSNSSLAPAAPRMKPCRAGLVL